MIQFLPSEIGIDYFVPSATITNLRIINSSNTNFFISQMGIITLKDVFLANNFYSENTKYALFEFQGSEVNIVQNIVGVNNTGPVFGMLDGQSHQISNCSFTDSYTSRNLSSDLQVIVSITQGSSGNSFQNNLTIIDGFHVNVISFLCVYSLKYRDTKI